MDNRRKGNWMGSSHILLKSQVDGITAKIVDAINATVVL
jgi:hypothetical protein